MTHLIDLYNQAEINNITQFLSAAQKLDGAWLAQQYGALKMSAPRRAQSGLSYFPHGCRHGLPSGKRPSNRREEHLAMALYNSSQGGADFRLPNGQVLHLIDYQTPFKAKQSDRGVGKIDLLGVLDQNTATVIELKIDGENKRLGDTPLRAFLEGLAYCAMFDANVEDIVAEANSKLNQSLQQQRPVLIVVAPDTYWLNYLQHGRAGDWLPELNRLASDIRGRLNIESHFIALKNVDFSMGHAERQPKLNGTAQLISLSDLALGN